MPLHRPEHYEPPGHPCLAAALGQYKPQWLDKSARSIRPELRCLA
jgi:hypothetical protein